MEILQLHQQRIARTATSQRRIIFKSAETGEGYEEDERSDEINE